MAGKIAIVALALFVGCMAVPSPDQSADDVSFFFNQEDTTARIGSEAPAGSHPHMVALSNGLLIRSFFCGGSLISQRTILTAAHCVASVFSWGSLSNNVRATVGTNRWNSGGQTYSVSRNVTYPHYLAGTIKNDISILITATNVVFNELVAPISLTSDYIGGGVSARVAGWGRIRANGALSATLLEIIVPTIDGDRCVGDVAQASLNLNVRAPPVEPHIEVCTFHAAGTGTCNGDSGSALSRVSDGRQFGIVSWGFPCALGAPDMFVRLSAYTQWLAQNVI